MAKLRQTKPPLCETWGWPFRRQREWLPQKNPQQIPSEISRLSDGSQENNEGEMQVFGALGMIPDVLHEALLPWMWHEDK